MVIEVDRKGFDALAIMITKTDQEASEKLKAAGGVGAFLRY